MMPLTSCEILEQLKCFGFNSIMDEQIPLIDDYSNYFKATSDQEVEAPRIHY